MYMTWSCVLIEGRPLLHVCVVRLLNVVYMWCCSTCTVVVLLHVLCHWCTCCYMCCYYALLHLFHVLLQCCCCCVVMCCCAVLHLPLQILLHVLLYLLHILLYVHVCVALLVVTCIAVHLWCCICYLYMTWHVVACIVAGPYRVAYGRRLLFIKALITFQRPQLLIELVDAKDCYS